MASMFNEESNDFERSISNYQNNANSVAQGALGSMGSLKQASRNLAQSGEQAQASSDSNQISSQMMAGGQKFAKELGMDVNVPLTEKALGSGMKSFGGFLKSSVLRTRKMAGPTSGLRKNVGGNKDTAYDVKPESVEQSAGYGEGETPYSGDVGGNVKTYTPSANAVDKVEAPGEGAGAGEEAEEDMGDYNELGHWDSTLPAPADAGDAAGVAADAANDGRAATQAATQAAGDAATTEAEGAARTAATTVEDATEELATSTGEKIASALGTGLSGLGGFLGDLVPVVGAGFAAYTGYESIKDMDKTYGSAGDDPYAAVRADLAQGQAKIQGLTAQISSDQFASKVGGAAPAFGSLAAPTFSTAQQTGGATGHF